MRKCCVIVIVALCAALTTSVDGFENKTTTLKNGDSETYEYQIKTSGGEVIADDGAVDDNRVVIDSGISYGKIAAHSTVSICRAGCELTLTKTGQTLTVQPGESHLGGFATADDAVRAVMGHWDDTVVDLRSLRRTEAPADDRS